MFIKLTGNRPNSTVMLLISKIIAIDGVTDSGGKVCTEVSLDGAVGMSFAVAETPEQIMEMIENARN